MASQSYASSNLSVGQTYNNSNGSVCDSSHYSCIQVFYYQKILQEIPNDWIVGQYQIANAYPTGGHVVVGASTYDRFVGSSGDSLQDIRPTGTYQPPGGGMTTYSMSLDAYGFGASWSWDQQGGSVINPIWPSGRANTAFGASWTGGYLYSGSEGIPEGNEVRLGTGQSAWDTPYGTVTGEY